MKTTQKTLMAIIIALQFVACTSSKSVVTTSTPPQTDVANPPASNRTLLRITESTDNGKNIELKPNYRVVDPNSTLEIRIDKAALSEKVAGGKQGEVVEKIKALENLIAEQSKAMGFLKEAITIYTKGATDEQLAELLTKLAPIVNAVSDDPEIDNIKTNLFQPELMARYTAFFSAARELIEIKSKQILEEAEKNGVAVQLGAWIDTKEGRHAVHIDGFDDIAEDNFKVDQFQLVLNDEQKKQLEEFGAAAEKANKEGIKSVIDAKDRLKNALTGLLQLPSILKMKQLKSTIEADIAGAKGDISAIRQNFKNAELNITAFEAYVNSLVVKYQSNKEQKTTELLLQINQDFGDLLNHIEDLQLKLQAEAVLISANVTKLAQGIRGDVTSLTADVQGIAGTIKTDVNDLREKVSNTLSAIISGESTNSSVFEFDQLVKKISVGSIPSLGLLNLEGSGKRAPGDKITIKLVSYSRNGEKAELVTVNYRLYFCTAFVTMAPSFLFTDPYPVFKKQSDKSLYYYAPSYSVLVKGFFLRSEKARKNITYHTLFSPGLGVNIATLDFNSDGAPEIGVGGTVSIFSDFLQVGYGVNTVTGNGYSFFGFKFPVGSLPIR